MNPNEQRRLAGASAPASCRVRDLPGLVGPGAAPATAARTYADVGWPVFPVASASASGCGCGHDCDSPGKHPLTQHGVHQATTERSALTRWWQRWPDANVGVATGRASGVVVVDIDLDKGGASSLEVLWRLDRRLPPTLTSRTGGGGLHLFYANPTDRSLRNTAGRLPGIAEALPGVDLRADGGYVVVPPSRHASGERYAWRIAPPLGPGVLPQWLCQEMPPTRRRVPLASTTRAGRYVAAALAGEILAVRQLHVGSRNDGLNRAAFRLGQICWCGDVDEAAVVAQLLEAATAIGLSHREAERTIQSGLDAGLRNPRPAPAT